MSTPLETLVEHEYILQFRGAICTCGHIPNVDPESLKTQQDYHREHLAIIFVEREAEAKAAALKQALEDVRQRRQVFRDLKADQHYLAAMGDAYGLVENRLRSAQGSPC